jgi:hemoglobin
VTTFYDDIGGFETFRRIVAKFYEGVAEDEVLRPYGDTRGHPRLRMRHAPFAVTPEAKDHWLRHFRAGLDEVALTPEQDAQFWDYVTHAAQFMVNKLE